MGEDVTVMSIRGQVVIPKEVRKRLRLKPRDRLMVYGEDDMIIMKRLDLPELKEAFKRIRQIVKHRDAKYGKLSLKEVDKEVAAARHAR